MSGGRFARRLADERGSTVLPVVLLVFLLLSAGGLGFDLYRLIAARQTVVGIVDAAAIAGATGLDEERYFETEGEELALDPQIARQRAVESLQGQGVDLAGFDIDVAPDGGEITVEAAVDMELSLLRLLLPTFGTAQIDAQATSGPRLAPLE
jgi:Putative Flp pilus-assembly TadE/G-like